MSDVAEAELFGNDDWSVQADGIEHRATGYFIAREVVAARRAEGLWDWPLQMAEKRWCRPSLFREAFLAALDRFGIATRRRPAPLLRARLRHPGRDVAGRGWLRDALPTCCSRATRPGPSGRRTDGRPARSPPAGA